MTWRTSVRIIPLAAASAALLLDACADQTAPGVPLGRFAAAPYFTADAAGIIPITAGRFVLRRTADDQVVKDTAFALAPGADSVDLTLTVPLLTPGETFQLTIALVDLAGDTVFRGGPVTVTPTTGSQPPPAVDVPLQWTGTGANALGVVILSPDTAVFFGESASLLAVALDSSQRAIPGTPVVWSSLDTARVRVPQPDSGLVTGNVQRGVARIVARLLTGQADTVLVTAQPLPSAIISAAGNGQTALPGALLPDSLVAQVLAADQQGVQGEWVRFEITAGGGSLNGGGTVDSALTGADGRAAVTFTLGSVDAQTVAATTARLPGDTAPFTATLAAIPTRVTWINPQGGIWSDGANWSTGAPPSPLDTAVIDLAGTYTVTLDLGATVGALTLGGPSGTQSLDVNGIQTLTLGGDAAIGPNGRLALVNGSLTLLGGNVLTLSGGAIQVGPGTTLVVGAGDATQLTYAAGTIGGPGALALGPGTQLNVAAPLTLDSLATSLTDATVNDAGGGRLVVPPPSSVMLQSPTGGSVNVVVQNQGVLLAAGTADVLTDSLYNEANASLQLGGGELGASLTVGALDNAGTISLVGTGTAPATLTVAGSGPLLNRPSGSVVPIPGATHVLNAMLVNEGTVLEGGSLAVNGPAGAQHLNTGTINVAAGQTLTITGGTFTNVGAAGAPSGVIGGAGTLDVSGTSFVNDGIVSPGFSPGALQVMGNYAQGATATLSIELEGTIAGTGYDQLAISGAATLNGILSVSLLPGFVPAAGDQFTVLAYGSLAASSLQPILPTLPASLGWQTTVSPTSYVLSVVPQILFAGDSSGGLSKGQFRVNADGSGLARITTEGPSGRDYPRWAPGGTRVTYTTTDVQGDFNQLHVATFDGSEVAHVVRDTSTQRARYNPTGEHLAFMCGALFSTVQDVCVVPFVNAPNVFPDLEGKGDFGSRVVITDQLTRERADGPGAFAWDPSNPDRLAFVRDSLDGQGLPTSRIYTALFDGTAVQPLSPDSMALGAGPLQIVGTMDWSPDGSLLVFPAVDRNGTQQLYTISRDGTVLKQLTFTSGFDDEPLFSPDGLEIGFSRDLGCNLDLWIIGVDGNNERRVTDERVCDFTTELLGFDWSPDGSEIALTGFDGAGNLLIYKVKRTTTAATYFSERVLVGRGVDLGGFVQDIQPSWRP